MVEFLMVGKITNGLGRLTNTSSVLINKMASSCAKNQSLLELLEGEINSCHNIVANTCEEFKVAMHCILDAGYKTCHLIDMTSFENDLKAFLIETYQAAPFASECSPYRKLRRTIFHMSTKLCSQNYIDKEKIKKEECSTVMEHNLKLQLQIKYYR